MDSEREKYFLMRYSSKDNYKRGTLYMTSVDQEKAFDRVVRADFRKCLEERGIFRELLSAVQSPYISSQAAMRTREGEISWFQVICGLR